MKEVPLFDITRKVIQHLPAGLREAIRKHVYEVLNPPQPGPVPEPEPELSPREKGGNEAQP